MEKKSFNEFLDAIEPIIADGKVNINYGEYEGSNVVIFDEWNDVHHVKAYLNGFKDFYRKPYVPQDSSIDNEINKLEVELKEHPEYVGLTYKIRDLKKYAEYKQYMKGLETIVELDDYEFDLVFSDEYDRCSDCGAILRTSPDSYDWQPDFIFTDNGFVCKECLVNGNYNDYFLEEYVNAAKPIPTIISPESLGLVKINKDSFEHGFFEGQNDSPEPIIKGFNKQGIDVYFTIENSQFYQKFDVYVKEEDFDKATELLNNVSAYQGYSTSENLKKCLSQISINSAKDSSEGIRYTNCNVKEGTVETKVISKEEFITNGVKD